jgi:hypothetical protein
MMKHIKLQDMTANQLIQRFVEIALAEYQALELGDTAKHNRLFDRMTEVMAEYLVRPVEQRRALMALYLHPNVQVRYEAAYLTKDIATEEARRVLEIISDENEYPQAANARGLIRSLDEGMSDMSWILEAAKRNHSKA